MLVGTPASGEALCLPRCRAARARDAPPGLEATGSYPRVWNHQRIELDRGGGLSPEHIDLQISVVVVRVHASRHLPPWLKEATVDACGGGTVSRWK